MYTLSVKVSSLGFYQGVLQSLGIITFQEFAVVRANSQTIFSNQLVCSICIGFLNNIWSIPF